MQITPKYILNQVPINLFDFWCMNVRIAQIEKRNKSDL